MGGWEGPGFGVSLVLGWSTDIVSPTAAKSLLNKKADGVKVRGQRGWG